MLRWVPDASFDRPAIISECETTTWNEVRANVEELVADLRQVNVQTGDRVWLDLVDVKAQVLAFLAVNAVGATTIFSHQRWPRELQQERASAVGATVHWATSGLTRIRPTPAPSLASAVDILFTSGSSGPPKAIVHDEDGHRQSACAITAALAFTAADAWALDLPLSHVGGLCVVMRACLVGGAIVLPSSERLAMDDPRATFVSAVPTHLHRVLDSVERTTAWSQKKSILVGGAAVPRALADRIRASAFGPRVTTSYGMTELTSTIAVANAGDVGGPLRPLSHVDVRIEDGRIEIRSPSVAQPASSSSHLNAAGYFQTGDRGRWVSDGRFEVLGREGRMFISGGENVTPEVVEAALVAGGARTAAVVDIPSEQWGSIGVAFVAGVDDTEALKKKIAPHLSRFERPKHVFPWPKTMPESKPQVSVLREVALQSLAAHETPSRRHSPSQ